jgi:CubicO group peptidase (beta-lactamase class C family)
MRAAWGTGLTIAALAAGGCAAHAQAVRPVVAARIDSVFGRYGATTPGCALLVRVNGQPAYERAYGLASLESDVPITPRTVFDLASASKEFTAASVMLLVEAGKLSLDDDVRKYVPELPELGGPATIRQLLTHTSGWRDYIQLLVWQGHEVRDHVSARDALGVLERQRALNFAPGTAFAYSNTGYFLLGLVVERVSGESLAQFAREHIFAPLGMHDTRYVSDARDVVPRRAVAYELSPNGAWREAMSGWDLVGDGGVQSTVEDLAKWDDEFESGQVGGHALVDSLVAPERLSTGGHVPYGFGLFVDTYGGRRRVWHNGIWAGYRSLFMRFPDAHVTIIALCNAANAPSEQLGDAIADMLLPPLAPATTAPAWARVSDADQLAGDYYSAATNQRVRVVVDSGRLALPGPPRVPLVPVGPRTLRIGSSEVEFRPARGQAQTMLAHNDGRTSIYRRVGPPLERSAFVQYEGRYWSQELGAGYTVVLQADTLELRDERGADTPLIPLFHDGFDGPGTVRFERDSSGTVTAMTFTTRGVDALPFIRVREHADGRSS